MTAFFRLQIHPLGLLGALGFLAAALSGAACFGSYCWWLEILSHFRIQYALFFLLLAGGFALGRKKSAMSAALVLAFANALPVLLFLLPPASKATAAGPVFRAMLMNVNTRHGNPTLVRNTITNANPDFLVLEEINETWVKNLEPALNAYPFRKIETRFDNFGIGLFSRRPFDSATMDHFGMADIPSIFAEFSMGGRKLVLVATHPLPPGSSDLATERNQQLEWIAHKVAAIPHAVLLLGDLNVSPWSPYYRRFLETSGLMDSAKGRSIRPTWPALYPPLWTQLDHALYSGKIAILSRKVGPDIGSDHYPLAVDFTWQSDPP